jgi:anti-sigma regulatory factor (Ser/Thr protein kinase)
VAVSGVHPFQIADVSQVGAARRAAVELARSLGFDASTTGRVSVIVTEVGTNLVKHGGGGQVVLGVVQADGCEYLQVIALDRGPGIVDVARSLEDGYSTTGSPGTGLGAMRRMASAFDIYSRPGRGTAVLARIGAPGRALVDRPARTEIGGISLPMPGEEACGDAWEDEPRVSGRSILVADGLGHGLGAAQAARESVVAFRALRGRAPAARVEAIHAALRGTRGAAVAVAELDLDARVVRFSGLGNIAARLVGEGHVRHLVSHNGTAGHTARRIDEFTYPWAPSDLLVMHTDGLATQRDLDAYPGLTERHPSLVAAVLYRDFTRGRDDVAVIVARERDAAVARRGGDATTAREPAA